VSAPDRLARLEQLEAASRVLDPDAHGRGPLRDAVMGYAEGFLDALPTARSYVRTEDQGSGLSASPIGETGRPIEEVLSLLAEHVDRPGLNPASGGHLGYIPGGGLYASALGDYLAAVTNRYAGVFFSSPGAVRMENLLVRWMADLAGYPASAGGTLLSGGSLANLTALAAARDAREIRPRDLERTVVYLSSQTHHCIAKALRVIGLGECVVRSVPLDARWRMRPDALAAQVDEDRRAGLRPWLVVATAGSTDTGAVDPLDALADVAADSGLWYHVDAAYGGFFLLTDYGRRMLLGIERSDSAVMDPHKTLFLPYGLGVVIVRDRRVLELAFRQPAPYMQDALAIEGEPWPADLSPELTRPFRGLRLWLPLMVYGVAPFRAALTEKLELARYFRDEVAGLGFVTGPEPDLSVVTYRHVPAALRDAPDNHMEAVNAANRRILDLVQQDGQVFISSTMLDGRFTLRFACVTHRTHRATVDRLLAVLSEARRVVEEERRLARAGGEWVPSSP
jgi:aromatic-L-amino-acid/L-tryptophan decarboxylase